jgi:hypothetical protein
MYHLYFAVCLLMTTMSVESVVKIQAYNEKNHNIGIQIEAPNWIFDTSDHNSDLYVRGYLVIANRNNSCSFIEKPSYKQFGEKVFPFFLRNISSHWVTLIEDSKYCSTTETVLNAKKAGYHAVIIHNKNNLFDSSEIRLIKITAFYINHSDAQLLKHSAFSRNLCLHAFNDWNYNITSCIILFNIVTACFLVLAIYFFYIRIKDILNEFNKKNLFGLIFGIVILIIIVSFFLFLYPFVVYRYFFNLNTYDLCK